MTPAERRVRLVPASLAHLDDELAHDLPALARLLGVVTILEWPPAGGEHDRDAVTFFRASIRQDPAAADWLVSYICAGGHLVGSAGFHGPPDAEGEVELGYSIGTPFRGQGLATAAVAVLVDRASAAGVHRVIARTTATNIASVRVLERTGFARRADRSSPGRTGETVYHLALGVHRPPSARRG